MPLATANAKSKTEFSSYFRLVGVIVGRTQIYFEFNIFNTSRTDAKNDAVCSCGEWCVHSSEFSLQNGRLNDNFLNRNHVVC